MNYVWDKVKGSSLYGKVKNYMRDYLGVDLNDEQVVY